MIFQIPLAVAPNIGTVLSCRFLQGFFGSAPLTNIGGTISDLFERDESGYAMAIYGFSSTGGPPLALIISSYIPQTLGWRWLFWLYLIIFGVYECIMLLTIKETRHNIILEQRAIKMRKETGNRRIYDPAGKERSLHHLFVVSLTRPLHFLFTEPITLLSALYNGFVSHTQCVSFERLNAIALWSCLPIQRSASCRFRRRWTQLQWRSHFFVLPRHLSWLAHRATPASNTGEILSQASVSK